MKGEDAFRWRSVSEKKYEMKHGTFLKLMKKENYFKYRFIQEGMFCYSLKKSPQTTKVNTMMMRMN